MFGYVTPIKEKLADNDYALYKAFYCGLCIRLKEYGQLPRLSTSYDTTFLAVLLHDFSSQEVVFESGYCIMNPVQKKATIAANPLLDKIACASVLLFYYKALDGVLDGEGVKYKAMVSMLKKAYEKAKAVLPNLDSIISLRYDALREAEQRGEKSLDIVSHNFAMLLQDMVGELLGDKSDERIEKLAYNLGKYVYLIDALDDVSEDHKKKRYNPFLLAYPKYTTRQEFFVENRKDIEFTLNCAINRVIGNFNELQLTQSNSLLTNIVHFGLRDKLREVLASTRKIPSPRL